MKKVSNKKEENSMGKLIAAGVLSFFVLLFGFASCTTVGTGQRGFKITFGNVDPQVLPEGLYFHIPFVTKIEQLDTQTQVHSFKAETYTRDMQLSDITYTLTFNLEPSAAAETYKVAGFDWQEKLVEPILSGAVKQVVGQFDAVELVAHRDKATQAVKDGVMAQLELSHVKLIALQLSEIKFSAGFEKAVEAKVIATQNAEQAKNKTMQIQEEANQRIIAAKAEAESMQIRSEVLAKSQNLTSWEAVQKWNGVLPMYMFGNSTPFINLHTADHK